MTTFALVHGAWHGGWCWERLTPELERRGHRTSSSTCRAPTPTPCSPTTRRSSSRRWRAWGRTSSSSATRSPATRSRSWPRSARSGRSSSSARSIAQPGASFVDQLQAERDIFVPGYEAGLAPADERPVRTWQRADVARETMFQDCAEAVAERRVRRGCARRPRRRTSRRARSTCSPRAGDVRRRRRRPHRQPGLVAARGARAPRGPGDRAARRPLAVPLAAGGAGGRPRRSARLSDVLRVDLLPPRAVLLSPARPVDRPAGERVGEVLEVDVPAGEREHDVSSARRDVVTVNVSRRAVAVGAQLQAQQPCGSVSNSSRRGASSAVIVPVATAWLPSSSVLQPAQLDAAARDEVDVGVGEPAAQLRRAR